MKIYVYDVGFYEGVWVSAVMVLALGSAAYGEFEGQHGQWCLLGVLLGWLSLILADGLFGGAQRPERRGFSWVAPIGDLHLAGWWYCCSARCWGFGTGVEFFMNLFFIEKR